MFPAGIPFPPKVWANLNAFAARLKLNFEANATCILKETLKAETKDKDIENDLPAAAAWIIYASRNVYHYATKAYTGPAETHQPYVRNLREFSKPFSEERWELWKERLEFLQNHEMLEKGTRESPREALDSMTEIEGLEPHPQANSRASHRFRQIENR